MTLSANETLSLMRRLVATELLRLRAVKLDFNEPFRLVSGNYSPIYVNCRTVISSPSFLDIFSASARLLLEETCVRCDVIAGGESAGIPFATVLSRSLSRPMAYVRKAPKQHGLASRVEGDVPQAASVLLVEDLITDASSKLSFIKALEDAGAHVPAVLVVFDRLQGGKEHLATLGINLLALSDMEAVMREAIATGMIDTGQEAVLKSYLTSPRAWHAERGLSFRE